MSLLSWKDVSVGRELCECGAAYKSEIVFELLLLLLLLGGGGLCRLRRTEDTALARIVCHGGWLWFEERWVGMVGSGISFEDVVGMWGRGRRLS